MLASGDQYFNEKGISEVQCFGVEVGAVECIISLYERPKEVMGTEMIEKAGLQLYAGDLDYHRRELGSISSNVKELEQVQDPEQFACSIGKRFLGIEKSIRKAKEGIGSKGFTKRKPREENRAPCGRTVPSCVRTCPWERFGKKFAQTRAIA
ncbi:hypothetical protein PIB30_083255 [Stylosanthes scabra]|uniref:Uncharacterized protein n=1 Tax=Stylosanthes scabra TaxID=79078 RepID=A0ABU6RSE7_9FABA|nr:hypothetical protein [Stylosanthes scabra]